MSLGQGDADALDVRIPLVLLGERIFGGPTDHVTMHNTSSARAAVEHLLGLGRTRIALIGAPSAADADASSGSLRLDGYRQALAAAGIPEAPELIRVAEPWNRETGATAARRMLEDGVSFDAVFALNDTLGLVARATGRGGHPGSGGCRRHRLRRHRRVAILGSLDVERRSRPG